LLENISTKQVLAKEVRFANTFLKKAIGLITENKKEFGYALVFDLGKETRFKASIHMLFMQIPINVIFLDSQKRVLEVVQNLKPWVFNYTPKKKARYIIELPATENINAKEGHTLKW
jgi:uncharacterized protein